MKGVVSSAWAMPCRSWRIKTDYYIEESQWMEWMMALSAQRYVAQIERDKGGAFFLLAYVNVRKKSRPAFH